MKLHSRRLLEDNITSSSSSSTTKPKEFSSSSSSNTSSMANKPISPITTGFDTSMALTLVVVFFAIIFMGLFSVYLRRFPDETPHARRRRRRRRGRGRHTSSSSSSDSRTVPTPSCHGVPPLIVKSLPVFSYTSVKIQLDCVVCLSEFEEKETVKMIPYCGHIFHPECIDHWLVSRATCPLCRTTQLLSSYPPSTVNMKMKIECLISVADERSTSMVVPNVEVESEVLPTMRRTCSCGSSLGHGEVVLLQRSLSF